jgi:hypothetical protein
MIDTYRPADKVSAMRAEIVSKFVDDRKAGLLAPLKNPVSARRRVRRCRELILRRTW